MGAKSGDQGDCHLSAGRDRQLAGDADEYITGNNTGKLRTSNAAAFGGISGAGAVDGLFSGDFLLQHFTAKRNSGGNQF